jgi:hypothetical protein
MTPPRHASACWHPQLTGREKKARTSFLKKGRPARGSKKLLLIWAGGDFTSAVQITKSFLLPRAGRLFFKKEVLS